MNEQRWYQKTWFMWLMMIVFFPAGLFLMWKYSGFSKRTKLIITAVIILLAISGMSDNKNANKTSNDQKPTAQVTSSADSSSSDQGSMKNDAIADNQKLLQEMQPKKDAISKQVLSTIGKDAKNLSVTVSKRDSFEISFEYAIKSNDEDTAKASGAKLIKTLIDSGIPYNIERYYIIMTDKKGSPIGIVDYLSEDGYYTFASNGQPQRFNP